MEEVLQCLGDKCAARLRSQAPKNEELKWQLTHSSTVPRAWWFVLKLITFRPGMYLISSLGILSFYLWPLLPGLFIRQIFDLITQGAPAGTMPASTVWTLAAVLIGHRRCAHADGVVLSAGRACRHSGHRTR